MPNYIETEILQYVPLNYQYPEVQTIALFARDICISGNEDAEILMFFNGGPGFSCIRDWRNTDWVIEALKTYRVVLMDQRGTGRSQIIDLATINAHSSSKLLSDYLTHFRADNIVRDAEFLRQKVFKREKITVLGQSFGGFVVLTYLSIAPHSLNHALITAGIAPLTCTSVNEIYDALVENLSLRNERFYQKFPKDRNIVQAIVAALRLNTITIGDEILTLDRFLSLGWYLGQEDGFSTVHNLLDEAFCDRNMTTLSWRFIKNVLQATSFWEINPLYSVLHEACYCNGFGSHWAADYTMQKIDVFSPQQKIPYFSGEVVKRQMFQDYIGLKKFSEAVDFLAKKEDWPMLYNIDILKNNSVPIGVLLMTDDFYVNYNLAQKALKKINNIRLWSHDAWQHDALRKHGTEVIQKLLQLIKN